MTRTAPEEQAGRDACDEEYNPPPGVGSRSPLWTAAARVVLGPKIAALNSAESLACAARGVTLGLIALCLLA